MLFQAQNK